VTPSFGQRLRALRRAAGLSQEELAERAGMSAKGIGALEREERTRPYPRTLRRLSAALELSEEDRATLLGGSTGVESPRKPGIGRPAHADVLPEPGPLPAGSRMPLARSPLFVGRRSDLLQIAAWLRNGSSPDVARQVAVTGMGGLGKTQLAVEFVHRYGRLFAGGVFWLSFSNSEEVPLQVAACGGPGFLGLRGGFGALGLEEQVALVRAAWQDQVPRLLVFDSCEDEDLLATWRPSSGGSRVLVTARRGSWDVALGVASLALDVLPRNESMEVLRRFRPDLPADDPSLDGIAQEIGDLPLALHLAGSFLRRYGAEVSAGEYLARLREPGSLEHASLLGRGLGHERSPTGHVQSLAQTFAISHTRLNAAEPVDGIALALAERAACLAPGEPMSRSLLLRTLGETAVLEERLARADALERLAALGLLQPSGDWLRMHRLLALFIRGATGDPRQRDARQAVSEALIFTGRSADEGQVGREPLLAALPHLLHAARLAVDRAEDERSAALCNALGCALRAAGDYTTARPHLQRAVAIRERVSGRAHAATARSLASLAGVLRDQGELTAARPVLERALAIRERVLGPDHSDTAEGLNDLACLTRDQGELALARQLFVRALAIRERVLGPSHPDTAQSLNGLAVLLRQEGELEAARPLSERALAIREQVLGPDHPLTAESLNNLAVLLRHQGEPAASRALYERALAICERVLGPDHPNTASGLTNLGRLLRDQNELDAARPLLERALAIRDQVLGADHSHTTRSLHHLAVLLLRQGELDAARPLLERAVATLERVLGSEHQWTIESRRALWEAAVGCSRSRAKPG
jgi:tetratricopeptide (TPR) repeat protein/transcriptional regulator with XRE-family HTH domain